MNRITNKMAGTTLKKAFQYLQYLQLLNGFIRRIKSFEINFITEV